MSAGGIGVETHTEVSLVSWHPGMRSSRSHADRMREGDVLALPSPLRLIFLLFSNSSIHTQPDTRRYDCLARECPLLVLLVDIPRILLMKKFEEVWPYVDYVYSMRPGMKMQMHGTLEVRGQARQVYTN